MKTNEDVCREQIWEVSNNANQNGEYLLNFKDEEQINLSLKQYAEVANASKDSEAKETTDEKALHIGSVSGLFCDCFFNDCPHHDQKNKCTKFTENCMD